MARKRTTVFADANDLAIIKATAARRGVAEAELLRDAIHLAAMAHQRWSEPFFTRAVAPEHGSPCVDDGVEAAWTEQAEAYERSKSPAP